MDLKIVFPALKTNLAGCLAQAEVVDGSEMTIEGIGGEEGGKKKAADRAIDYPFFPTRCSSLIFRQAVIADTHSNENLR